MAESGAEKSRGLRFAERQLLRHGWEHGKGLGRGENGISEAIKVKVKCDKGGIGHKEGDQFTFHWWDHVFNQTSASLKVESSHSGPKLHKSGGESEGTISNKKPLKASFAKDKLYGAFVKSATLVSGLERATKSASSDSSSSSSDDEDDAKLDMSSTTKMSDAELVKACGGRTAHKGARHGLNMSAKLARLEQQEAEFMAKYGKKAQTQDASADCEDSTAEMTKKKKKRKDKKLAESASRLEPEDSELAEEVRCKKKNKKRDVVEEEIHIQGNDDAQESPQPRKKKKKKSKE